MDPRCYILFFRTRENILPRLNHKKRRPRSASKGVVQPRTGSRPILRISWSSSKVSGLEEATKHVYHTEFKSSSLWITHPCAHKPMQYNARTCHGTALSFRGCSEAGPRKDCQSKKNVPKCPVSKQRTRHDNCVQAQTNDHNMKTLRTNSSAYM